MCALNGENSIHSIIAHRLSRGRRPTPKVFNFILVVWLTENFLPNSRLDKRNKDTVSAWNCIHFLSTFFCMLNWSIQRKTAPTPNKSNTQSSFCTYTRKRSIAQHIIFNFTTCRRPRTCINSRPLFTIHFVETIWNLTSSTCHVSGMSATSFFLAAC